MLLGDTVPRFRRDLKIQRKSDSGGLYEVSDPTTDKHFTLYDIELSIARMLDGHRTVQEVIEAGTKIGIPITLESLEKFEKQLTAYGFLQPGDAPSSGEAWAPRDEWPPEVREMFRSALLKYRQSRFDEATDYLKAMLAIDSQNKEAKEVLKSIDEKKKDAKPAPEAAPVFAPVLTPSSEPAVPKKSSPGIKSPLADAAPSPSPDLRKSSPGTKSPLTDAAPSPAAAEPRKSSPAIKSVFGDAAPSPSPELRKSSPGTKSPLTDSAASPAAEARKSSPGLKAPLSEPASSPPAPSPSGGVAIGRLTPPSSPAAASVLNPPAASSAAAPSFSALVGAGGAAPAADNAAAPAADAPAPDAALAAAVEGLPPVSDAPPAAEQSAAVEQSAGPTPQPLPAWAVPATGGALALAVLLMIPLPRSVPASVVLEAPNAVVVKAPRDLVVKEPAVKNGTSIEPGAVLLTLDGSDELGHLRPFDAKVSALQSELEHTQRAISKKQIASWQKTVKKLEGEVEKAKAALAKAGNDKARAAAQKKVADKERELLEANAELQDATKVDAVAKLKQQLEEATAARAKAAGEQAVLPSPAGGVVTELAATPGQRITTGAAIARIADPHELVVACSVDASEALSLAPGQKIAATLKGQSVELLAESVAGPRVFAKLVQSDKPAFIPGDTGDAKISVASRSLLARLFR